jgi:hypothetical protein
MRKSLGVIISLLGIPIGLTQQVDTVRVGRFLPAGTLIGCTLDEPNFSSKTALPEDPVVCKTSSVEMFGRPVIPRGAYLSARLRAFHDPGHFFGKGWMQLEFTGLTLPGGTVPLEAKVISAARYKVNGEGKIQGKGHPKRDAVEWAIPLLWPVKVLTLPARGPRPALKGETRIELRIMEDLVIPESAYLSASGLRPFASRLGPEDSGSGPALSKFADYRTQDTARTAQQPVRSSWVQRQAPAVTKRRLTLLMMRDGRAYMAGDYWVRQQNLEYTADGAMHIVPLDAVDLPMTRRLNAERGMPFVLATKDR